MAENTGIQWCHHTFNPWRGCTRVSAGCANCYAEAMSRRNPKVLGEWGPGGTRVVAAEAQWREPLRWDRAAAAAGERRRVFCASLADVFEGPETIPASAWDAVALARGRLGGLILDTPNLDWLLLTKRPENAAAADMWGRAGPPSNAWVGASVEDQVTLDDRAHRLPSVPAALRFLSAEPLLGPLDLSPWLRSPRGCGSQSCGVSRRGGGQLNNGPCSCKRRPVDWVIVGGESGPGARPCDANAVRDVVRQCREAAVPCFVKQLGARPGFFAGHAFGPRQWVKIHLRDRKGGDPEEWPEELRVREFPRGNER